MCFVHIGWRTIAVACVSWIVVEEVLLWHSFREHRVEKCCCGIGFVCIGRRLLRHVFVAHLVIYCFIYLVIHLLTHVPIDPLTY